MVEPTSILRTLAQRTTVVGGVMCGLVGIALMSLGAVPLGIGVVMGVVIASVLTRRTYATSFTSKTMNRLRVVGSAELFFHAARSFIPIVLVAGLMLAIGHRVWIVQLISGILLGYGLGLTMSYVAMARVRRRMLQFDADAVPEQ